MTENARPIIYLDFDGVLNAISTGVTQLPRITGFGGYRRVKVSSYTVTWSREVLDRLRLLQDIADIHWLSTWRADTAIIERELPVKLDGWFDFQNDDLSHSGKLEALLIDQAEAPRPFIWVDDEEHSYYRAAHRDGLLPELAEHLLIEPSTFAGLSVGNFELMEDFLSRHSGAQ
ncbi:hypothetical protein EDF62_1512 [Leucobacter luti]|uniref:FCP1 homology domain-containing protein n=1 Tax=Leucobacter luti TaxID=340320 RepID=A0A4R6S054_9MICO|nr:hypothetical protein [Leucobacter luti]TDP92307.1 hypothetical protein EDF62_1512 [Leucobacter luti]